MHYYSSDLTTLVGEEGHQSLGKTVLLCLNVSLVHCFLFSTVLFGKSSTKRVKT